MNKIDNYSTHLPLLEKIFSVMDKPKTVLEFGMGNFSTQFFIEKSENTISIEMQSEEWYNDMFKKFSSNSNWSPHLYLGPETFMGFKFTSVDLCFVDGHGETRPECVNHMMNLNCPIIIAHDTETSSYGWDRVNENHYKRYDYKKLDVWTTVWTTNENLLKELDNE
jgi:hypothetical protein